MQDLSAFVLWENPSVPGALPSAGGEGPRPGAGLSGRSGPGESLQRVWAAVGTVTSPESPQVPAIYFYPQPKPLIWDQENTVSKMNLLTFLSTGKSGSLWEGFSDSYKMQREGDAGPPRRGSVTAVCDRGPRKAACEEGSQPEGRPGR